MRFLGIILLCVLSACDAPVAEHREEVPLRLFRWEGERVRVEVLPAEPLRVEVRLYRAGRALSAHLRTEGGLPAEGDLALVLEGPGGERAGEAFGSGRFLQAQARLSAPACAFWLVSLSPDPFREEALEVRSYEASGRFCEGKR
ncbi:hypothetical protein [Thermus sp. 93170]|uniref:hypothetical protein n=1 Tax=Thermus sp. 93170 TaxID=1046939 RepID=UPI003F43D0FC